MGRVSCINIPVCVDTLSVVPVCYAHSIHSALHHSDFQIARKSGEIFYTTTSIYNNPILWLRNIVIIIYIKLRCYLIKLSTVAIISFLLCLMHSTSSFPSLPPFPLSLPPSFYHYLLSSLRSLFRSLPSYLPSFFPSDVDDREAANLAEAFRENKSVKTLGLAHNMIGTYETLRTTQPDFKTGAESLADMLLHNTTITELDLSWNSIRSDSAAAIGRPLI